jgi:hypothetical protein
MKLYKNVKTHLRGKLPCYNQGSVQRIYKDEKKIPSIEFEL